MGKISQKCIERQIVSWSDRRRPNNLLSGWEICSKTCWTKKTKTDLKPLEVEK